ncbi:MAG: hypothetical protein ACLTTQ_03925 [Christensenellales bacterium]
MPVVSDYKKVKEIYADAAKKAWVIPCICSENLTTTEAIFAAAEEFAVAGGYETVPVTIAMTIKYSHRPQATYYTHSRRAMSVCAALPRTRTYSPTHIRTSPRCCTLTTFSR